MSVQTIDRPFVAGAALRSVNFFNGRLLTGDDLRREQSTQEARLERLGRVTGSGVAEGFEVEAAGTDKARPVVTVSAGLALTRSGIALELPADVDVALYREQATAGSEPGNLFAECQPFAPGTYTAGAGVYLLTVGPAEQGEGRAPVNGLGNETAPCNVALEAEALRFRLIRLALDHNELSDKDHLRNRVAYACFGAEKLAGVVRDPFGPPVHAYGLVDLLRTQLLTDDEVPLATIGWSIDDGIGFVDLWSVRRRITRRSPDGDWAALLGDRRRAEGEAMFLQFQQQIEDLKAETDHDTLAAKDHFRFLPPIGALPLGGPGNPPGFALGAFFTDFKTRDPLILEAPRLPALLGTAFDFPPIEITTQPPETKELTWIYEVRANLEPDPPAPPVTQEYLIFANGQTPYAADPRFDLAYWDFANYALAP